jgi:hypothetical protein
MKTFIAVLSALLLSTASAQITLEHEIPDSNFFFSLVQIDSGEYYYMTQYFGAKPQHQGFDFKLFDLNYNLIKEIDIPIEITSPSDAVVTFITRRLFDLDDGIEYLIQYTTGGQAYTWVRVFDESGDLLYSCDSCTLGYQAGHYSREHGIYNTPNGPKMLIMKHYYPGNYADPTFPGNRIYSLPGKLPSTTSDVEDISYIQSALDIEAIPNPASDHIQINYHLPAGMLSGYITIRDTKGAELQTHSLNYTEGSISIDVRDLSPGSYYCCLLTNDGRTTVKKMMVVR